MPNPIYPTFPPVNPPEPGETPATGLMPEDLAGRYIKRRIVKRKKSKFRKRRKPMAPPIPPAGGSPPAGGPLGY